MHLKDIMEEYRSEWEVIQYLKVEQTCEELTNIAQFEQVVHSIRAKRKLLDKLDEERKVLIF